MIKLFKLLVILCFVLAVTSACGVKGKPTLREGEEPTTIL